MITNAHRRLIGAMLFSVFSLTDACAAARKMECREWLNSVGVGLMGTYVFSLNDNGTLDVLSEQCRSNCIAGLLEDQDEYFLLFRKIKRWTPMWAKNTRAVFYGISDDQLGPVSVLSLDFGKPNMYDYQVGGAAETMGFRSKSIKECRRLN